MCLFLIGCRNQGTPPEQGQSQIQLAVLDVGTMDVTLKISLNSMVQSRQILFKRDDDTVWVLNPTGTDTIIVDPPGVPELWPSTSYTYRAYLLDGETAIDSSEALVVTTGDSSSHAIQWTIDTIGTAYSYLKDVTILGDSIWVVGELYKRDSVGNLDQYNMAQWNGQQWELIKIQFYTICGQASRTPYPASSVFATRSNEIWLTSNGGQLARWNGSTQTATICMPNPFPVYKIWGDPNSIYAVGYDGRIARYGNGAWLGMVSGTNVPLTDIWGTPDGSEVWACGFNDSNGGSVVLRRVNGAWQILWDRLAPPRPPYIYSAYLSSLWSSGSGEFVATGGRFYRHSLHNLNIIRNEYVRIPNGYVIFQQVNWAYRVRGTQRNDVWLVGDDAMIWHWNGSTWHRYEELLDTSIILYSLAVTERHVVAVGTRYDGIYTTGVVIRGRR